MNLNKATLIGRLTRDPELKTTPSGKQVTTFSVATSLKYKDQSGQRQEKTEFHNIVSWGKQAEVIAQYFTKGQEIYLEGRMETRSWDDKETGKKMYRTEIVLDKFEFGAKPQGASNDTQLNAGTTAVANQNMPNNKNSQPQTEEEDIPTINLDDEKEDVKIEDVPF